MPFFQGEIEEYSIEGGKKCNDIKDIFHYIIDLANRYEPSTAVDCVAFYIKGDDQVFQFVSYFIHLFLYLLH